MIHVANGQVCSNHLCRSETPQICCYAAQVNSTDFYSHCCAPEQTCCGKWGWCCSQGYFCCGGMFCCPQEYSCTANGNMPQCTWSSGGGCFSGDNFVLLTDGLQKPLKDLRSGDKVYSVNKQGQIVKDEIIMMLHGGSQMKVLFYTIIISDNQSISLTGDHLIMIYSMEEKRSDLVAANELKVGDFVLITENNSEYLKPVRINSISVSYKTGFYTPMTYTGTLLVNGIAASCYVKHQNTYNEMHTLLYPFRLYYYLMKDIFRLSNEPYPIEMRVYTGNDTDEFYGTRLIRSLHQSKKLIKYIVQDLLLYTILNI